jgi:hypothetical protein
MPHPTTRSRSQAGAVGVVTKLSVLAVLAAALVVLPAPRVVAVESAVVETRTPALLPVAAAPGQISALTLGGDDVAADLAEPGRRISREEVPAFDLLGVTVPTAPEEHLLVRGRVAGRWTPWMHIELNPEHRPEGRERATAASAEPGTHSEPVWFGGADAYEVSAPAEVPSLEVHLVRSETTGTTVVATGAVAGAAVRAPAARPSILTRSQWGARPPAVTPSIAADLKIAVVHHSVTNNTYSSEQVPALLRSIQTYHMDVQGWNDIAYNVAVDRFGRIWEARAGGVDKSVIGGHAQGFNTYSSGVMVLGDFRSAQPSQAAVDAVADVIGWRFADEQVDVRGTTQFTSLGGPRYTSGTVVQLPRIVGHRDVGVTSCPGSELYRRLGEIRMKAAAHFDRYITLQPETPLFGDFDGDGLRDVLRYRPGARADVLWSRPGAGLRASLPVIEGTYRPVVADLDGDGRDDILWYAPGSSPGDRVWYGGAGGFTSRVVDLPEQGLPHVAELDGDGIDDVVIYAPGASPDRIYSGRANRTLVALPLGVNATYDGIAVGDFDGDSRDDLLWYGHGSTADVWTFSEGDGRFTPIATSVGSSVKPVVGDFDGNGLDDVFLYGPGDVADEMWWSDLGLRGLTTTEPARVRGTSYRPQVGDVNGDGSDDLLWYNPGPSADPLWTWSLLRQRSERVLSVGGTYVPDLGRYTGDGLDDIAWISPTGASYLWVATGGGAFRSVPLG